MIPQVLLIRWCIFFAALPYRRQYDGCWFANVCQVEIGFSYFYEMYNDKSQQTCKRLSLGAREMYFCFWNSIFSLYYGQDGESNRVSSPITANSWKGVTLQDSIFYQVFLPSFTDSEEADLFLHQMVSRISYLKSLGITALELFPIEQYRCESNQAHCWSMCSYRFLP